MEDKLVKWVSFSIIGAALVIAGVILYNNYQSTEVPQTAALIDAAQVVSAGYPVAGDMNAPVTMVVWSDYQCPFCKKAEQDMIAQVVNEYVKAGKVKVVYKDFAFLGGDSTTAALAAHAVWETAPDKFEAWNKAMFEKQDGENTGWGNKENILELTQSLGIDSKKVGELMSSKSSEYQDAINKSRQEAGTFGITGTPSFVIGKKLLVGARPYSEFKAAIEEGLQN